MKLWEFSTSADFQESCKKDFKKFQANKMEKCNCHHSLLTEPHAFAIAGIREEAVGIRTFIFKGSLQAQPGQFAMVWLPDCDEKPFSISRDFDGEIHFTICRVGQFTEKFFTLKIGDRVGLRGPFGRGFQIAKGKSVVLVAGGYGLAPLFFVAKKAVAAGCRVQIIAGARSADLLFGQDQFAKLGVKFLPTTNDGSAGVKGFSTDLLQSILQNDQVDLVQTCGPEKMMRRVAEICQEGQVPCEVSVERFVKCGFGVCGQCVVDSGEKMCQSGPVVPGEKALGFADFGVFHRGAEGQRVDW